MESKVKLVANDSSGAIFCSHGGFGDAGSSDRGFGDSFNPQSPLDKRHRERGKAMGAEAGECEVGGDGV